MERARKVAAALLVACACNTDGRLAKQFGPECRVERRCNGFIGIDCESAVDGPYYYVRESDHARVATCGGACWHHECENCPPKEWTCPTY